MEMVIKETLKVLIKAAHSYNVLLQYRSPQDSQCFFYKGKIEAATDLLKEFGYPVVSGGGRVNRLNALHYEKGYGYITFSKNLKELEELGVLCSLGFENGIYWFIEGNGSLIEYKG